MAVAMAEAPASYAMRDEPMESMMAQQRYEQECEITVTVMLVS